MNTKLIEFDKFSDHRGVLSSLHFLEIPFIPKRLFTLKIPDKKFSRGGHAHKECWQLLIPIDEAIKVDVEEPHDIYKIEVQQGQGLIVPPLTWITLFFTKDNSTVLVLASHGYSERDYIRDKSQFRDL